VIPLVGRYTGLKAMAPTLQPSPLNLGRRETPGREVPQLRQLQSVHENFARALSASLSSYLQAEIQATLGAISPVTAGDFLGALNAPACVIRLQLHPRAESMILHLHRSAVFNLLELLLGGKGGPAPAEARELTEIEWSLLEEVVRVVVRALGDAWHPLHEVEFRVESLENDPAMLAVPDPALQLVQIAFTLQLGQEEGAFQLGVPQSFFEPAAAAVPEKEARGIAPPEEDVQRNLELLSEAMVDLEVVLDGSTMMFGELAALKTGQVLTFDYSLGKPLRALVNGAIGMPGHVVSAGRKRAFQVEELP
jgi:flagellar motor switch protein FliM